MEPKFLFTLVAFLMGIYVVYMLMTVIREYYERKRIAKRFEKEVENEDE